MLDLEPIRARAAAATKGPWEACDNGKCSCKQVWSTVADCPIAVVEHGEWGDGCRAADGDRSKCHGFLAYGEIPESVATANAAFIAAARTDVPALVEEVERLRKELEWYSAPERYKRRIGIETACGRSWPVPIYAEIEQDKGQRARALLTPAEAKPDA